MSQYIDLQVNGYAGIDFNSDELTDADLLEACRRLVADDVEACLATVITADRERMLSRIARIVEFCETHRDESRVIAGIHVEGPFINPDPGYVGAHPPYAVLEADLELAKRMLEAGRGRVRLLTLAPERDPGAKLTGYLTAQGVHVAGGHSGASRDELREAIDAGLVLWTHLGNGCPAVMPRHDNIIQRVLSQSERLSVSFIADGHHVPSFALRNYLRAMPLERVVIVSDAMHAAGLGPGRYRFAEQNVEVDASGAAWSEDRMHLAGSAATLRQMEKVLREQVCAEDCEMNAWMRENPRRFL